MLDTELIFVYVTTFTICFVIGKICLGKVKRKISEFLFRPEKEDDDEEPRFRIKTT